MLQRLKPHNIHPWMYEMNGCEQAIITLMMAWFQRPKKRKNEYNFATNCTENHIGTIISLRDPRS